MYQGDCLEVMADIDEAHLVLTDPPYFRVKGDWWDKQWSDADKFIHWIGAVSDQWHRLLAANGSLYCFASPQMAARVEVELSRRFNVLNRIRWIKEAGWHNKAKKESLRSFLSPWEECIFAEHYNSDNTAKGEAGYVAKCDELRGFVFEPLRAYLCDEWNRSGLSSSDANEACGNQMAGHYFTTSQWALPTSTNYEKLRARANATGGEYLRREYEDLRREYEDLRREYEDLRREYEDLRRPFFVSADVPFTDVWNFKTVSPYSGKHPCEKPQELLRHAIKTSSKPGQVVLDSFAGSGSTGVAALALGRKFVGIEMDQRHFDSACRRIEAAINQPELFNQKASA